MAHWPFGCPTYGSLTIWLPDLWLAGQLVARPLAHWTKTELGTSLQV